MRKFSLAASTAIGIVIGVVLFNAAPARADLPTIDATVLAAVNAVKGVLSDKKKKKKKRKGEEGRKKEAASKGSARETGEIESELKSKQVTLRYCGTSTSSAQEGYRY